MAWRPTYHSGTVAESIAHGSKTIYVYCMGTSGKTRCQHIAKLNLADLPKVSWRECQDRLRCPKCGARGRVQIRFNHDEGFNGGRACNIIDGEIVT